MPDSPQGYGPKATSPFGYALHHVLLSIPEGGETDCRPFYVDVLGMTEVVKPPRLAAKGGLWVRADNVEIHLGVEKDFRPARKAHPGIRVVGLAALESRLNAAGIKVDWDDGFPGHRRFYVSDPHGNRLEFIEREESGPADW
jgi:catechol 2,3-dioxygenase-like lactoylglutathione lyase family enzyme